MNYDNMSDEDIKALYEEKKAKVVDYSQMSDEEIKALYEKKKATSSEPTHLEDINFPKKETTGAQPELGSLPPSGMVQPEDTKSTIPTTLDLSSDMEKPQYLSDTEKEIENNKRHQEAIDAAKISGFAKWTDTEGRVYDTTPGETDSLEDVSFEAIPFGRLGWVSGSAAQNEMYDVITHGLVDTGLSREAKILLRLNQGRLSEDQAIKVLKGVPKEDQAEALANRLDLAKNYFREAVGDDSILATKLGRQMEQRKNLIEPFTANEEDLKQAQKTFGEMKKEVDVRAPHYINTKILSDKIKPVAEYYKTDPSPLGASIRNIMLDLSDDKITVGNALDIRENINLLLRKPAIKKVHKTRESLETIKGTLDKFIKDTIPEDLYSKIDTEISKYGDTINRKLLGDIIDNNTKSDFAVDWGKVVTDAKKEGLSQKISKEVVPLLKELSIRFHNDKHLASIITPESKHANLNALGVWSKLLMETLDKANNLTMGVFAKSRYKDNLIINSLRNSIKNSDTPLDFVDDIVKKGVIPKDAGAELKTKLLEYKPGAKITGDVNLKPKYVTKEGTVGENPTIVSLHDAQRQLVDEALGKPEKTDKVMGVIDKMMKGKRAEQVLRSVNDRMKANDIAGNQQMLRKIIKEESDYIIKAIEKDTGIKLPQSEAEKIYRLKIKDMMKECE